MLYRSEFNWNVQWSPGGATTPSITVNPTTTTNYTLTFTNSLFSEFLGDCSGSSSLQVQVGNKVWVLDQDNDGYYTVALSLNVLLPVPGMLLKQLSNPAIAMTAML